MRRIAQFIVHGTAAPQGSKRYLGQRAGKAIMVESSKRLPSWRSDVRDAATRALGDNHATETGPVCFEVEFYNARPRSHYGTGRNATIVKPTAPPRPTGRPDLDKLLRAVADALTGVVWRDDAQIVSLYAGKFYGPAGARITAWTL